MTGSTRALARRLVVVGLLAMMTFGLAVSAASADTSNAATGSGSISLTASCAGTDGPAVLRYSAMLPAGVHTGDVLYKVDPIGGPYTATFMPANVNRTTLGWNRVQLHGEIVIGRTSDLPPSEAVVRVRTWYSGQIWNDGGGGGGTINSLLANHQATVRLPSCPGNG
jgi:hypothetical protein